MKNKLHPWLTVWFPAAMQPARIGVYERRLPTRPGFVSTTRLYSYWNGNRWGAGRYSPSAALAMSVPFVPSQSQYMPWRGLAGDPNSKGVQS